MKLLFTVMVQLAVHLLLSMSANAASVQDLKNQMLRHEQEILENATGIAENSDLIEKHDSKQNWKIYKNKTRINENSNGISNLTQTQDELYQSLDHFNAQSAEYLEQKAEINKKFQQLDAFNTQQQQNNQQLKELTKTLDKLQTVSGVTSDYLDRFWVLIAAVLVFFMQAGFKTFESGMVRRQHEDNVAIKNILDWVIISLAYFVIGFGIMFGDSFLGLFGTTLFGPTAASMNAIKQEISGQHLGLEFFLFQLVFAATAATIVSGAMSERMALIPYILLSMFIGIIIYPIFGHWVWGGSYLNTDQGWLYRLGFRDFAGSTVVHAIGAWVALAGVIEIGPRMGRYNVKGELNKADFLPANMGYSTLGVFILWFGWWGFNGGSQLKYDEHIATIILNTTLAGASAGTAAFFQALTQSREKYEVFPKLLGGILGGLVAITACCNIVSSWQAMMIGIVAGLLHNLSHDYLTYKLKLDDPVGAIAVHGVCGVWGTLSVALFGDLDSGFVLQNSVQIFEHSSFPWFSGAQNTRLQQLLVQIFGSLVAFAFAFLLASAFFKLIKIIPGIGLRVTLIDEKQGALLGSSH